MFVPPFSVAVRLVEIRVVRVAAEPLTVFSLVLKSQNVLCPIRVERDSLSLLTVLRLISPRPVAFLRHSVAAHREVGNGDVRDKIAVNGYPQVDILRILVGSFDAEDEGCSGVCRVKPGFADVEGGESRIIDEYDLPIRDDKYSSELDDYISFLVSLFKSEETNYTIALAYLTGIMPIIKEKTQSKLNNFKEYTMLNAKDMAPFMGFTEDEVKSLSTQSGMEFDELKKWYDGYDLEGLEIYSPKSVISAIEDHECSDYWVETSSYEAVTDYISLDFEGLKEDVISMFAGNRVEVRTSFYRNTMSFGTKDDVLTYLIHLGYLAYDADTSSCFIPNNEIKDMWALSIERAKGYKDVFQMIKDSKKLLESTWNGDEEAVAESVAKAHMEACSILEYNN